MNVGGLRRPWERSTWERQMIEYLMIYDQVICCRTVIVSYYLYRWRQIVKEKALLYSKVEGSIRRDRCLWDREGV